ncbi:MAG TPA: tetratricopeptide repeat protein [Thermoanaerobaculia bacterium]|jgi:tetratricopeptide (TPR) repeat protein
MKPTLAMTTLLLLTLILAAACGSRTDLAREETQSRFGVRMARMNLWREALFRFKRVVEMNPNDPKAHSNLAVAYEANGEFEKAVEEYKIALRLDRSNQYIQKNYSRLVEFTSRNKKRQPGAPAAGATTAATGATTATPAAAGARQPAAPPPADAAAAPPATSPGQAPASQPTSTAPAATPAPQPANPPSTNPPGGVA